MSLPHCNRSRHVAAMSIAVPSVQERVAPVMQVPDAEVGMPTEIGELRDLVRGDEERCLKLIRARLEDLGVPER